MAVGIVRASNSVYKRKDWLASTATHLGGIEIRRGPQHEELEEVKCRPPEFLDGLPEVEGEKIILPG